MLWSLNWDFMFCLCLEDLIWEDGLGKDQISAGNIIAIVSTPLYSGLLMFVVAGGPLGAVMFVDIGALPNPTLTFEDPILSTHWPPSNNSV